MRQRYGNHDAIEPWVVNEEASAVGVTPKPPKVLRVVKGVVVVLCAATSLTYVLAMFLHVSPSNPVSQRFHKQTDAVMQPWFAQAWSFFAPNPKSDRNQIFARTISDTGQMSEWFDISAVDRADMSHNPFPSHTTQNMLSAAWDEYLDTHDRATGPNELAPLQEKYLRNIAVQRFAAHSPEPIQLIQMKIVTRWIQPWDADKSAQTDSDTRLLPWWEVTRDGS